MAGEATATAPQKNAPKGGVGEVGKHAAEVAALATAAAPGAGVLTTL